MLFTEGTLNTIRQKTQEKQGGYPYLVALLKDAGVKEYTVDMVTRETIYTMNDGSSYVEEGHDNADIGEVFDKEAFLIALRANQKGETDFPTWFEATRKAGCEWYLADLKNMEVVYQGHDEEYREDIPTVSL